MVGVIGDDHGAPHRSRDDSQHFHRRRATVVDPADIPYRAGCLRDVFQQRRFRAEFLRHGSLAGECRLEPARAEFVRLFADMILQNNSCAAPPFSRTGMARVPSSNRDRAPVKMSRSSADLIAEMATPLLTTTCTSTPRSPIITTCCAMAAMQESTTPSPRMYTRVLLAVFISPA